MIHEIYRINRKIKYECKVWIVIKLNERDILKYFIKIRDILGWIRELCLKLLKVNLFLDSRSTFSEFTSHISYAVTRRILSLYRIVLCFVNCKDADVIQNKIPRNHFSKKVCVRTISLLKFVKCSIIFIVNQN